MNENAQRGAQNSSAAESAADNIRRYLDIHRFGSPHATSVVLQVLHGSGGRESGESASDNLTDPEVCRAIRRLRRHRGLKIS